MRPKGQVSEEWVGGGGGGRGELWLSETNYKPSEMARNAFKTNMVW